jgi:CO/xanthine dehydrogenase Mo-binding subunit
MLVDLAARKLGVSADTLTVRDGVVSARDGRSVRYGELAGEANLKREATVEVAPKPPDQHKIVGKPIQRARPSGQSHRRRCVSCRDIRLPGMLHGRVVRPPHYGAKLESLEDAKVKATPGIVAVVRDGSFLGVVAEREEQGDQCAAGAQDIRDMAGGRRRYPIRRGSIKS